MRGVGGRDRGAILEGREADTTATGHVDDDRLRSGGNVGARGGLCKLQEG